MKINPVNNINFKQIVETFRKPSKGKEKGKEKDFDKEVYEKVITYTETVRVPKSDETLQQVDYVV